MEEGVTMVRQVIVFVLGVFCHMITEGNSFIEIQADTLTRWPRDYNGIAVVPSQVRHIGYAAFAQCKSLTGVVFPSSIETIGHNAFMECDHIRDIRIPSSVTNIGSSAFANCLALTSAVVHASIEEIPKSMCSGCYSLKHVKLPDGVLEVGDGAFCGCRSIVGISIPESVRRIGNSAFAGCSRIRKIVLPKSLQILDKFAFYGCYDMRYLVAYSELRKVGDSAFRNCHGLRGFIVEGMSPVVNDGSLIGGSGACTVFVVGDGKDVSVKKRHAVRGLHYVVKSSKTIEDAIAACDAGRMGGPENEIFRGLERALRIAAEGLISGLPENNARVAKLDALVANLDELKSIETKETIKKFLIGHSQFFGDSDDRMTADIDVFNDIGITAEFHGNLLVKLTMSEGLKNAIRKGLEVEAERNGLGALDDVFRWLK